ncbi:MAG: NADPH-dependent FMN reductase, partial [Pseudolabrys sp.]
ARNKMTDQLNVLVICGSLRKGSYNAALTRALPGLAPSEMKLITAPSIESLPLYNSDIQEASGFPRPAEGLAAAIRAADGVLFVTPEYNWSMPGGLKNAIDWLSRMKDQPFKEKPVAIQSCSQGPLGGARMQYHWRMSMTFLNAFIFGTPEIFVGNAASKFDKTTLELTDQPTKDIVQKQLAAFANFIKRMKAGA